MAFSVTSKYIRFRWTGPTITLNTTNAPWLSNVLLLVGHSTPNGSGVNGRTQYKGSFGGATPGGALSQLVQNADYEMNSGAFNGWTLPNATLLSTLGAISNQLPTVSLFLSANSAQPGGAVTLTATANDPDGTIAKVEYYNGSSKIGESFSGPTFSYVYSGLVAGSYAITARAFDNVGGFTNSAAQALSVQAAVNQLPSISLAASSASITAGAAVNLTATASDPDGSIAQVQFYSGSTELATDLTSPYTYTYTPPSAGSYALTAKATDNAGGFTTSSSVALTVSAVPVVSSGDPAALTNADFSHNAYPTGTQRSAASELEFFYDGNQITFSIDCQNGAFIGEPAISVYDAAGTFLTRIVPTNSTSLQNITVNLPGSGRRKFRIIEGGAVEKDTYDFAGSYVRGLLAASGKTVELIAPVRAANVVAATVDSIGQGDGTDNNSRYGMLVRLREMLRGLNYDVVIIGWGSASAGTMLDTPTRRRQKADLLRDLYANRSGEKWLIDELLTNDVFNRPIQPATMGEYKSAFWDLVQADTPAVKVRPITGFWRSNITSTNSLNYLLSAYSDEVVSRVSTRPWAKALNTLNWVGAPDFVQAAGNGLTDDGLHPAAPGHYKIAQQLFAEIRGVALTLRGQVGEILQNDNPLIAYTPAGGWVLNDTPDPETGIVFRGGSIQFSSAAGAKATFKIAAEARQIQFRAFGQGVSGSFKLRCNGTLIGTYSQQTSGNQNDLLINSSIMPVGNKTMELEVAGDGNVVVDEIYVSLAEFTPTSGSLPVDDSVGQQGGDDTSVTIYGNNATHVTRVGNWSPSESAVYPAAPGYFGAGTDEIRITGFQGGTLTVNSLHVSIGGSVDILIGATTRTFTQLDAGDPNGHLEQQVFTGLPAGTITFRRSATGGGQNIFFYAVSGNFQ